ncbi:MAG: hypothetical protein AYP45_00955 [Candidatus Brocadia carolinensis]|uniref:Uncharacterized protein n=1 Tax=Candidatus Brocadia carolinensis TaxID=1004156 RepID=A0A1V4AXT0_9BACT|nr:MAG: hypothetical protein AYP45_00955 [Candidatus Brocadia caroliniensis]
MKRFHRVLIRVSGIIPIKTNGLRKRLRSGIKSKNSRKGYGLAYVAIEYFQNNVFCAVRSGHERNLNIALEKDY